MKKEPKVLFTFMKRADIEQNRIIIPKFFIDNYGRDFYLEVLDDGTIKLIPITKLNKKEMEE
jgi:hypothetical protein